MTMAAGFRYADGVMFCADSQITHGDFLKTTGAKIAYNGASKDFSLVTTGAGHMGFMEWFFERIDASLASSDKTAPKARQIIERALDELYKRHISPYARRHRTANGEISMLVGFVGVEKTASFWRTDSTALIDGTEVECVGSGSLAGMFFASKAYRDRIGYREALAVATQVLKQVKAFDPYTGGETLVVALQNDGKLLKQPPKSLARLETFLNGCEQAAWDAILKCSNPQLPDTAAELALQEIRDRIKSLREEMKPMSI
jgi:20S proteasome alpha/beta subunit